MSNSGSYSEESLTFSQRYGYEPLPKPMHLEEISDDLRREIWNHIRKLLKSKRKYSGTLGDKHLYYFPEEIKFSIERILGKAQNKAEDEVDSGYESVIDFFKKSILDLPFNKALDLIEFILHEELDEEFTHRIVQAFKKHGAAYQLDVSRSPYHFSPQASKEQGDATRQAIETTNQAGMNGASTHLRQATEHINAQQYSDAIADSIHAVESVARVIDPKASKTLDPALDSLEKAGILKHKALKRAFITLYGYTNDEQGIRHALRDKGAPDVGLDEAMFMFGACASFAAYLTQKHRQTGEQEADDA